MFNIVTIAPSAYSKIFSEGEFLYLPITFSEEVKYTCEKTVIGNWMLKTICEMIKPLKGFLIRSISANASIMEIATPILE